MSDRQILPDPPGRWRMSLTIVGEVEADTVEDALAAGRAAWFNPPTRAHVGPYIVDAHAQILPTPVNPR